MKRKYKVVIAYDGTGYSGWQYQENAVGIQQVVEEVLRYLEGGPVRVFGSSRTDAGVHAKGFVGHFHLTKPIPPKNLVRAMNSRLPEAVRVLKAAYAKEDFDARLSAKGKEYRYQLYQADILPPHLVPYWTFCHRPLDLAAMRKAAGYFVGKHDFVSFAANPNRELESTVRTIHSFEVKKAGPRYTFVVRGDGFLYKQVRSMVGFLIAVGKGHEKPAAVKELLEAKSPRTARVETAPARGLFLWKVFYGSSGLARRCRAGLRRACLFFACLLALGGVAAGPLDRRADKPTTAYAVLDLPPSAENSRNSEGDFALLKDGRILYVYSHYLKGTAQDHDPAILASRVSSDGGRTWSAISEKVLDREDALNVMSVSFLRLKDGSLALFYLRKATLDDCRPMMRVSRDEGRTWSAPVACVSDADAGYYVMNNARVIRLASGRILLPLARHARKDGKYEPAAQLMSCLSDDDGLTWRLGSSRVLTSDAHGNRIHTQEPGAVELKDGRVLMYARTASGRQWFYYSSDGGDTWTSGEPGLLWGPLAPATVKRLKNGDLLAVWNDHENHPELTRAGPKWAHGSRAPLTVAVSKDEGRTWPLRRTLEDDLNGWFCYTAVLELDDCLLFGYCAYDNLAYGRLSRVPSEWVYGMTAGEVAAVRTATAGEVKLVCSKPAGWRFSMTSRPRADGREEVAVRMASDKETVPPACELLFGVSGANARHVWTCFDPYAPINPNHFAKYKYTSQLAQGMPLAVAFDEDGASVVGLASTEVFEKVFYSLAFNDRTCALEGKMKLFSANPAPRRDYEVKFLIDRRGKDWCQTVQEASTWISVTAGLKPAEVPESAYDALYSTWYAYWQDVCADQLEKEAALAAKLGMKTMILDDGWQMEKSSRYYSKTGDWQPVASRFPDMKAHVAKVHALGLKYMIWFSVPFIGEESAAFARFKGKYLCSAGAACGAWVLDPRFPEVRQYLVDTFVRAVREWGFDGLKLDFIDRFVLPSVDPAVAENYAGRDIRSVPAATDRLMKDILAALRAVRPDVLVEFRQRYMGPAMLQYGNMMRALDCPADPAVNRRRIADLRLTSGPLAVHADMLMWCPDDDAAGAAHPILSALFGVVQYSMVLSRLPASHQEIVRHWIGFAERHRAALLKGRFTAHHPELGYTLLESESESERVMAVYAGEQMVHVKGDKPTVLVNGSRCDGVVVDFGAMPAKVVIFDTLGRRVGGLSGVKGLVRLPVPKSGFAEFRLISACSDH